MQVIHITDPQDARVAMYAARKENVLIHYFEPEPGIFITESTYVTMRAAEAGYEILSILAEEHLIETEVMKLLGEHAAVPVYTCEVEMIREITGFPMARGILAILRRKKLRSVAEVCERCRRIVVMDDVENPTNVGAITRSAAALGMDAVVFTPCCADPLYRRASRVSMGTCFQLPWTFTKSADSEQWMQELHALGFKTVAMALREDTYNIDARQLKEEEKLAVILGNEGVGLPQKTIDLTDYTVCIPMQHGVDSLNVSTAAAVAFWELSKRTNEEK